MTRGMPNDIHYTILFSKGEYRIVLKFILNKACQNISQLPFGSEFFQFRKSRLGVIYKITSIKHHFKCAFIDLHWYATKIS